MLAALSAFFPPYEKEQSRNSDLRVSGMRLERIAHAALLSVIPLARAVIFLILLPAVGACSVGMALSGEEEPDLTVLRVGAAKYEIERELGPPDKELPQADGYTQSIYHYEVGNEPSGGRAAMHGAMDVLTLGLWELAGTPMEAMQGDEMELVVTYDSDDKAQKFDISKRKDKEDEEEDKEPRSYYAE